MKKLRVFNVQGFSLHDGEGIRTCVFFKGCPLRCAWCHNPEGRRFGVEWSYLRQRCAGCGACENGEKPERCVYGARSLTGEDVTPAALCERLLRERAFYEQTGGGVTLTGGECMTQDADALCELMKRLTRRGLRVAVDTCGEAPWEAFEKALPYTDVFLYDIKLMDEQAHEKYTGVSNVRILDNFRRLCGEKAKIWLRVPLIAGLNDTEEEQSAMRKLTRENCPGARVALLPYHDIGRGKYQNVGMDEPPLFSPPSDERLNELLRAWRAEGFDATIGG